MRVIFGRPLVKIDDVIFARFVECRGHIHVQWRCPDCKHIGSVGLEAATEPFRVVCTVTEREFLVVLDEFGELASAT